ncbi:MAG TPA: AraC family transcriptional regulator [Burkholderiaceae bacterium]|nr:AraC family transcriptional regulator [Burkholderiaceae bacterium]
MDNLSGVLKSVRLEGALFLDAQFTAPWCMRGRYGMTSVRQRLAGADHVVLFHFLVQGACRVRLAEGGEEIEAVAGDLILFPQDDRHLMGSDLRVAPLEADHLIDAAAVVAANPNFVPIREGGGGAATHFVCGYLACIRGLSGPLFAALPRMLRIRLGDNAATTLWRQLMRAGVHISGSTVPGAESTLAKIAELMLVEALRRHVASLPPEGKGLLAALRDVHIGRALALLHEAPERAWTVDDLARQVALSRSLLATRFASLVGESPMQYLTRWRLARAARVLRAGNDAIARIAERSGYATEAAFSRAFKREFGLPPSSWRKTRVGDEGRLAADA